SHSECYVAKPPTENTSTAGSSRGVELSEVRWTRCRPSVADQTAIKAGQGFPFDLTDPLTGQTEGLADLFERLRFAVLQPEPHAEDRRSPLIHPLEHPVDVLEVVVLDQFVLRALAALVRDDLAQRPATVVLSG